MSDSPSNRDYRKTPGGSSLGVASSRQRSSDDTNDTVALIVLAAGAGTRMRSQLPKPLHPVAGRPMVSHVLAAGLAAQPETVIVVVSPATAGFTRDLASQHSITEVLQAPPRGTGHAVKVAVADEACHAARWAVVLYADHPLLTAVVVSRLISGAREANAKVTTLACRVENAAGYGRLARDDQDRVVQIVEAADDEPHRRAGPTEINSGMMVLDLTWARAALERLRPNPKNDEIYLTDLVELAAREGGEPWPVATVDAPADVAKGINDRVQLAEADAVLRARVRTRLMLSGVTISDPTAVYIDDQVVIGPDTTILPSTHLTGQTVIGSNCVIGPQTVITDSTLEDDVRVRASTIENSVIRHGADVGPYSHLRSGSDIGPRSHIGNFAELKRATLGAGVKVGHFSYLGDTRVGDGANIGAGTVTANYDGHAKHQTTIGEGAFIGSDTILRAPVRVGDRAITGAASVVTKDVPDDALVVGTPARRVHRVQPNKTGGSTSS